MRLLKRLPDGDLELTSFNDDNTPSYAILSHTWGDEEVTFNDIVVGTGKKKSGYAKVRFCADRAAEDDLEYCWMDTCCIDKSSAQELQTAINLMFQYYKRAKKCYVYLSDVKVPRDIINGPAFRGAWIEAFCTCRWFTRGWTLQELLAPPEVEFYSVESKLVENESVAIESKFLGNRLSLEQDIHEVTKIPISALRGQRLTEFSTDERMSWVSGRSTTINEDIVYCLLGVFGVSLVLNYGEGAENASYRLKEEVEKRARRDSSQCSRRAWNLWTFSCLILLLSTFLFEIGRHGFGWSLLENIVSTKGLTKVSGTMPNVWSEKAVARSRNDSQTAALALPFPRNELFVGREDELRSLKRSLLSKPSTHQRAAIYGLGGCGKSALALEFAYRTPVHDLGRLVFWVPAMNQESFELAYRDIGLRLQIPGIADENADVKQLVKDALTLDSMQDWLMIVDNADDPEILMTGDSSSLRSQRLFDYLPRSNRGSILFTTRSRKAAHIFTQSNVFELKHMDQTVAKQLLARRLTNPALLDEKKATNDILSLLSYLPLAIVQASAFMNNNDISISDYISLFQNPSAKNELFNEHFEDPSRYPGMESTIAKTWYISFDQMRKQDPLAAEYLSFMACIDPSKIAKTLLPAGSSQLQQYTAIGTLTAYAFITERQKLPEQQEGEKFYDMHPLVHTASVWWLEQNGEQLTWMEKVAARYEEVLGHKHPYTLMHMHKLALLHIRQCNYQAAEALNRRTMAALQDIVDSMQRDTSTIMGSLTRLLGIKGKSKKAPAVYKQALGLKDDAAMHTRALELMQEVVGTMQLDTFGSMHDFAQVMGHMARYEEANTLYEQACTGFAKVLGEKDGRTLDCRRAQSAMLAVQREDRSVAVS